MNQHTQTASLPVGVSLRQLVTHRDSRGDLTEIFRHGWGDLHVAQWNLVRSNPGIMRGMHVHLRYTECYVLLSGRIVLGMRDTRGGSPTENQTAVLELTADPLSCLVMPTGIVHGVYAAEAFELMVGLGVEWVDGGDIGCHWTDPDLGIRWPFAEAQVSGADGRLPPLRQILDQIPPYVDPQKS